VIAIDDYPCARIEYRGDPDMYLPLGFAYGDIGMKLFLNISFFCVFQKE
jgi:hypothetical protein